MQQWCWEYCILTRTQVLVHLRMTPLRRNKCLSKALLTFVAPLVFSCLIIAQTFTPTGSLNTGRNGHRAIALKNGMVLIAGGYDFQEKALASCELYDPMNGSFSTTGSLNVPRRNFGITLLDDGTVLVTGGYDASFNALASAEIYDPAAGMFRLTGSLNVARGDATATRLSDGTVLIAGGFDTSYQNTLSSAEIYVPSAGTFALTGNLNTARGLATATALMDGTVLIAGGGNSNGITSTAEIYDPVAASLKPVGSMSQPRARHTATLLNGGDVLMIGGVDSGDNILPTAEIYSPSLGRFIATGNLSTPRGDHAATLLTNGMVLVEGGFACDSANCVNTEVDMSASAEVYDPTSGSFIVTGNLSTARQVHTATLIPNGMVLIAGGFTDANPGLTSAEIYQPATFTPTNLVSISISPASPSLSVGDVQALAAVGTWSDNSTKRLASVIWSSSDSTVATVTNDSGSNSGITNDSTNSGVVLGMAPGTAILTACAGTVCGSTTVTVGPPGGSQGFSLNGSPGSLTVAAGEAATFSIILVPQNGFNQTVALSCGALPPGARCSISPSSLALNANSTATAALTITTNGISASINSKKPGGTVWARNGEGLYFRGTALAGFISLGLCFLPRRKRRTVAPGLLTVFLLVQIIACGGANSPGTGSSATPRGTYTITVTGSSTRISTTARVNLIVK